MNKSVEKKGKLLDERGWRRRDEKEEKKEVMWKNENEN